MLTLTPGYMNRYMISYRNLYWNTYRSGESGSLSVTLLIKPHGGLVAVRLQLPV